MNEVPHTAQRVADAMAGLPGIVAMSLGGSTAFGFADAASDLDIHVYMRAPLADAHARAEQLNRVADAGSVITGVDSWGLEDHVRVDGMWIELVYVDFDGLLTDVDRAYSSGIGGEGFVTAQFTYVVHSALLHDSTGELATLRERLQASYPEPTRQIMLRTNPELLRIYLRHLGVAQQRGDLLFVQHRRYSVQMVFFNLLFALNRRYHPGEKRLLLHAQHCLWQPPALAERWNHTARLAADDAALHDGLKELVNDLCTLAEANQ